MNAPAYRIDGVLSAREAFYAVACDPRRSVVVEACAGAGKTWMLVSRILRALLDGAEPQEILAITFTRKAAGEMRSRLADWLREFALAGDAERVQALMQRGLDARAAQAGAAALAGLHARVLAGGRAVEVRTFHAWFSQLLRAAPLELLAELGLQPEMALIEDLDDLRPELFRRFHPALLADAWLHAQYTALVAARGRATLRKWLETAWARRVEIELADEAGQLDASVEPAPGGAKPLHRLRSAPFLDLVAEVARGLGQGGKRAFDAARALHAALAVADDEAAFAALWSAVFTKDGDPRKLGDDAGLRELCAELQALQALLAQQQAHREHLQMAALSRLLLAEYAALKRRRALVDMADLERVALALLADATLSGWVQERLDARVRHLLIDEFQDTSPLQWHALHAWLAAYAGAGGGRAAPSVFIVGDPKQSIYRFRRAEPRVFAAARDFVAEALHGAVLECDHTRRNAPAVMDAVNGVFGALADEGLFPGWRAHSTEIGTDVHGEVRLLPSVERPPRARAETPERVWRDSLTTPRHEPELQLREAEAAQVAAAVHELLAGQGFAPGEVFVLSRKRASLRLAAAALQALQIPFAAPEETELALMPEVRDLVALLDVLASPGHDLSLAQALKSPLFGVSDDELLALSRGANGRPWWSALQAGPWASPALQRAQTLLARWAAAAQALPPHDLLDRVVHEGDLFARLAAVVPPTRRAAALQAVNALLGQALQLDGGRYATPYNFVRALRQRALKSAAAAQPDAVQLLTIHGAKGLEARAVFVMDSDPELQNAEHASLLVDWPVESPRPQRAAFVASESRCPPSLRDTLAVEDAAREREERNGLYVAMTRARERLVFSRTPPLRAAPGLSWWARVQPHAAPWTPASPAIAAGAAAEARIPVLPTLHRLPAVAAPAPAALDAAAARLGQAVHRVLEWAAASATASMHALAEAACAEFAVPAGQAGEVARLATQVLHSPACARFFDPATVLWAGNEVPVADAGEPLRIDRLVRLPDAWWVLDYKLGHGPAGVAAYRAQLARYRRAVQALQPGEPVRAAFITGAGDLIEPGGG